MRYIIDKLWNNEPFFNLKDGLFSSYTPFISINLNKHFGLGFESSKDFFKEQVASLFTNMSSQDDLFRQSAWYEALLVDLPSFNAYGQNLKPYDNSSNAFCNQYLQNLNAADLRGRREVTDEGYEEKELSRFKCNMLWELLPTLTSERSYNNFADFVLPSVADLNCKSSSDSSFNSNLNSDVSLGVNTADELFSSLSLDNLYLPELANKFAVKCPDVDFNLGGEIFETLKKRDTENKFNGQQFNPKLSINSDQSNGNNLLRIEDITYSNDESVKLTDMLAGKFDTQVDMNDFILQTCGFKSLLSKDKVSGDQTLFDAIKLASYLKTSGRLKNNEDAVSVMYELFQGDDERLSSIINDLTRTKINGNPYNNNFDDSLIQASGFNAGLIINTSSRSDLLRNKLKSALSSFNDRKPNFGTIGHKDSADNLSAIDLDTNMQTLLTQIGELVSSLKGLNITGSIVEPINTALDNMTSAIENLTELLDRVSDSTGFKNNINDYRMGSQSSRMP
ncbi:hypothetical protein [Candidatus Borreliella tachyglossi]|uniref:hypothetical protein n=1 Tax=Candidatus Borreliella tachyglossi TaxID=1964448 RepID=UPI0040411A4D